MLNSANSSLFLIMGVKRRAPNTYITYLKIIYDPSANNGLYSSFKRHKINFKKYFFEKKKKKRIRYLSILTKFFIYSGVREDSCLRSFEKKKSLTLPNSFFITRLVRYTSPVVVAKFLV